MGFQWEHYSITSKMCNLHYTWRTLNLMWMYILNKSSDSYIRLCYMYTVVWRCRRLKTRPTQQIYSNIFDLIKRVIEKNLYILMNTTQFTKNKMFIETNKMVEHFISMWKSQKSLFTTAHHRASFYLSSNWIFLCFFFKLFSIS